MLNDLYTMFDTIIRHYDVYKVETVGDAYLCVSGLPNPNGDQHAAEIALMALEFIQTLQGFTLFDRNGSTYPKDGKLKMRIGNYTENSSISLSNKHYMAVFVAVTNCEFHIVTGRDKWLMMITTLLLWIIQ